MGSSARITGASFANAAAIDMRCCSPPLSSSGLCSALGVRPTISRSSFTLFFLSFRPAPIAIIGSSMFSAAVSVGIRFKVWKMCPTVFRR